MSIIGESRRGGGSRCWIGLILRCWLCGGVDRGRCIGVSIGGVICWCIWGLVSLFEGCLGLSDGWLIVFGVVVGGVVFIWMVDNLEGFWMLDV